MGATEESETAALRKQIQQKDELIRRLSLELRLTQVSKLEQASKIGRLLNDVRSQMVPDRISRGAG